ncbi:hypothetical protein EI74_0824 [Mycoplasma testudineum]|uniref:Uncharacterized protein n=1 Tax=Mycoplasma testudineum TaxID=244584 RepID=A0A4R6IDM8_9MOLU|nr:hypothetical protein [Mycoplasma testudineum]TDO19005.1 hypothetical protein EI74_0824 [Mycoplasma testudineum]
MTSKLTKINIKKKYYDFLSVSLPKSKTELVKKFVRLFVGINLFIFVLLISINPLEYFFKNSIVGQDNVLLFNSINTYYVNVLIIIKSTILLAALFATNLTLIIIPKKINFGYVKTLFWVVPLLLTSLGIMILFFINIEINYLNLFLISLLFLPSLGIIFFLNIKETISARKHIPKSHYLINWVSNISKLIGWILFFVLIGIFTLENTNNQDLENNSLWNLVSGLFVQPISDISIVIIFFATIISLALIALSSLNKILYSTVKNYDHSDKKYILITSIFIVIALSIGVLLKVSNNFINPNFIRIVEFNLLKLYIAIPLFLLFLIAYVLTNYFLRNKTLIKKKYILNISLLIAQFAFFILIIVSPENDSANFKILAVNILTALFMLLIFKFTSKENLSLLDLASLSIKVFGLIVLVIGLIIRTQIFDIGRLLSSENLSINLTVQLSIASLTLFFIPSLRIVWERINVTNKRMKKVTYASKNKGV